MVEMPSSERSDVNADSNDRDQASSMDLRSIVQRYHAAVYRYAYRLAGNQSDAEDLTQQAFLVAQQRLDQVRDPSKVLSWLFAVLRSCHLKNCRRQKPAAAGSLDMDLEAVPAPIEAQDIDREALQLALDELPAEFRVVLLMFYFEGYSYKEIAERLDAPIGTVMSRLARGKNHLRKRLTERGERHREPSRELADKNYPTAQIGVDAS
jgi:RNA polymerase sigma-70 factor (ECF subfamily)